MLRIKLWDCYLNYKISFLYSCLPNKGRFKKRGKSNAKE